ASRASSWSHVLPVANDTAAQRNPFRTSKKRVQNISKLNAPLCGIVDAVNHAPEEPDPPESGQRYPEPWVEEFLEQDLRKFENLAGVSHIAEHRIVMHNDRPIKQRYFPRNPAMRAVIDKQIDELLRVGRIEPSKSPHSAPIVIAAKKNGDARIRTCTAFTVPGRGLFHWRVMPFGLHSAPATFQRALYTVIGPDMEPHAFAYLDDIIVIGSTLEEHVKNLREVFRRLRR
ncbi:hypothetical protein KR032_000973, partial [Drosophila birchii]